MPVYVTPDQLADFVKSTLKDYDKKQYVNLSFSQQNYPYAKRVLDGKRIGKDGGEKLNWKLKTGSDRNVRMSGMFATDNLSAGDVFTQAEVEWKKVTYGWCYDEDEKEFNSSDRLQIIDYILAREQGSEQDFAEFIEESGWTTPASSTANQFLSIPYYLVKPTAGQEGQLGTAPSGHTTVAGVNPSIVTSWKSYVADYDAYSQEDLIEKWIKANEMTKFMAPVTTPELRAGPDNYAYYTTYAVWAAMRFLLRAQNDNLGKDVAAGRGAEFYGRPIEWVSYLTNNDTQNPIYGVNWGQFQVFAKTGRWRVSTGPIRNKDGHSMWEVYRDSWMNLRCLNRREAGYCLAAV